MPLIGTLFAYAAGAVFFATSGPADLVAIWSRSLERIPLGRIAEVQDVTGPVLFFLGPASAFVTGQILYVDGGITATQ